MAIREGSTRVDLYNEGLAVWLYDDSHQRLLKKQKTAELIETREPSAAERKKIDEVAAKGPLVGCELRGDGAARVGPPFFRRGEGGAGCGSSRRWRS